MVFCWLNSIFRNVLLLCSRCFELVCVPKSLGKTLIPGNTCTTQDVCTGGSFCVSETCVCPPGKAVQNAICVTLVGKSLQSVG